MIIKKEKRKYKNKNGRICWATWYLLKCHYCGKIKWHKGTECDNGRQKCCSPKCIRKSRDKKNSKWTKKNVKILVKYYPLEGVKCKKRMEYDFSDGAIHAKALKTGIKCLPSVTAAKPTFSLDKNDISTIKTYYLSEGLKCFERIGEPLVGLSKSLKYKIAKQLGLQRDRSLAQKEIWEKPGYREKMSDTHRKRMEAPGVREKMSKKMIKYWEENEHPSKGKPLSKEHREKLSKVHSKNIATGKEVSHTKGRKGKYKSKITKDINSYDSLWELIRMISLDGNPLVETWTKKHGIVLEYNLDGKIRGYIPDFYIQYKDKTVTIEEVKGRKEPKIFDLKMDALIKYCKKK